MRKTDREIDTDRDREKGSFKQRQRDRDRDMLGEETRKREVTHSSDEKN